MLCTSGAYGIAQLHHTTCHIQTCRRKLKKGTQHAISYVFKASSRFSFCYTLLVSLPPEHFFLFQEILKISSTLFVFHPFVFSIPLLYFPIFWSIPLPIFIASACIHLHAFQAASLPPG